MLFKMSKDNLKAHVESVAYHFYINDPLLDPEDYTELIDCLYQSRQSDSIFIHLNCPGGRVDIAMQIINAIKSSEASVVAIADGQVASAASLILFSCPRIAVQEFSYVMLHDGEEGFGRKVNENLKQAMFTTKLLSKIAHSCYSPFFSEEEINEVLEGKDLWLSSEEVTERLQKVGEQQEEEIEEEQEEKKEKNGKK